MAHDVRPYQYHGTGADDLSRSPVDIAHERAATYYPTDAYEQDRFIRRFSQVRIAELRGKDTWWLWRDALVTGDSVLVAAHIEGAASVRRNEFVNGVVL